MAAAAVGEDSPSPSPKRKKDEEPEVMSGQTEEERRFLRREQRQLLDRLGDRSAELASMESSAFEEERNRNNALFKKVKYTRELGNDGENLAYMSELATKRSAQLARSVSQYSSNRITTILQNEYGSSADGLWLGLGRDVGALFATIPRLDFMCGGLEKPEKTRKAGHRKKKGNDEDDMEETQYETIGKAVKQHEEATNKRLQSLLAQLEAKGAGDKPVDVMNLCVNPRSFHETVENFFDLSFLVKDSKAGLALDPETQLPTAALTEVPDQVHEKRQTIVVLSPQNIKDIAEVWDIERAVLNREEDSDDDDDDQQEQERRDSAE